MSDFERVATTEAEGNAVFQTSRLGDLVFISSCWTGDDGQTRVSKSKKGNPFMLSCKKDDLLHLINHLDDVAVAMGIMPAKKGSGKDIPF